MKNFILIAFLGFALASCSKDNDFTFDQFPQKWQLVSMSGQIANAKPVTGDNMPWQEYYVLNADGTFTKTRVQNGETTEASGTFAFEEISGEKYLMLTYETDHPIIGNCTIEPKEALAINAADKLSSTWQACDGPGLIYERVNVTQ